MTSNELYGRTIKQSANNNNKRKNKQSVSLERPSASPFSDFINQKRPKKSPYTQTHSHVLCST